MNYDIFQRAPSFSHQSSLDVNLISSNSLIDQLSNIIHEVQSSTACCSSCDTHTLTNGNKYVKELCRILNNFFSSGLLRRSEGYWPLVKEFTSKAHISDILQTWKPQTSKGKSLAWLYQCLNDGTLEWHVRSFIDNFNTLSKYYKKNAYMLDKQTLEVVAMYLRGLDDVDICLQPRQRKPTEQSFSGSANNGCSHNCKSSTTKDTPAADGGSPATQDTVAKTATTRGGVNVTSSRKRQAATVALLEQSVADFSGCPDLLGLSAADTDLLLTDAELCDEALEYNYPSRFEDKVYPPDAISANRVVRKRRQPVTTKFVPKIVETTSAEAGVASSLENSINNDFSLPPTELFNSKEVSCSTPLTQTDADAMFREIIKGRRLSPEGTATPPKYLSPTVEARVRPTVISSPTNDNPNSKEDQESVTVIRSAPSTTIIETDLSKSEFYYSVAESESALKIDNNNSSGGGRNIQSEAAAKSRSENMQISPRHDEAECTATPPNTFINANGFLHPTVDRTQPKVNDSSSFTAAYSPRSAFERQILNRLENVVLANRSSDTVSEKSSETSSIRSSKKSSSKKLRAVDSSTAPENGTVESAADPQTVLTKSSEILLESGEVLELTVHVMKEGEQFYKMFRVFCNHHVGSPLLRYLLLTNTTLYLLIDESTVDKKGKKYNVEFRVSYNNLDYISVGLGSQLFSLHLRQRQCIVICTASDGYTRSILSNLELAIRRAIAHEPDLKLPSVLTDATPQKICLNKWIMGEIGVEDNIIHQYSLVYWNPNISTKVGTPSGGPNRNGYLYMREFYPNSWIKKSTDWQQSYFILRGKKFYQFEDLQCKFGKRVFDLQEEVIGCRQAETAEHTYCIELIFQDDSVVVQLSCPTKHELQQWLHAFVASFSQAEAAQVTCACLACCAVITDGFILLGQETTTVGFVRTLAISRLDALHSFKVSRKMCSLLMIVPSSTVEDGENWLLCFICESELDKFINTLKSLINHLQYDELQEECEGAHLIRECYHHWSTEK